MATGHHSSSKRVLTPNHYKKTLNRRIQPHCAYTRRQREQGGRAPYQSRRSIFGKGRPSRTSIFCTASLPPAPLTTLCGDFPPSPRGRVQKDPKPRREREGAGSAGRRSHATRRAGWHHVVPAAEECREGGTRTHTRAHAHSWPRRPPAPAFHPERRGGPRTPRPSGREQPAGRRRGARRPTVTRPPSRPCHSLPRRHTPLASPHAPLLASHFPLTGCPARSPFGSLSRRKVPRIREGKHRIQ